MATDKEIHQEVKNREYLEWLYNDPVMKMKLEEQQAISEWFSKYVDKLIRCPKTKTVISPSDV